MDAQEAYKMTRCHAEYHINELYVEHHVYPRAVTLKNTGMRSTSIRKCDVIKEKNNEVVATLAIQHPPPSINLNLFIVINLK